MESGKNAPASEKWVSSIVRSADRISLVFIIGPGSNNIAEVVGDG